MFLFKSCYIKLVLNFLVFRYAAATDRVWKHTTSYNDKNNWENGQVPCDGSTVVFPEQLDTELVLPPTELKYGKMVLPRNGDVMLRDSVILLGEHQGTLNCGQKKDFKFKTIKIGNWLDTNSWSTPTLDKNTAVPDLERIPCSSDVVIFPNFTTFICELPEVETSIKALRINGRVFTEPEDFNDYLYSEIGAEQFRSNFPRSRGDMVGFEENDCTDQTGCLCHQRKSQDSMNPFVCTFVPMEKHLCKKPIQPVGFCHPVCVSSLTMEFGYLFNFKKFKKFVESFLKELHVEKVDFYISKVQINSKDYIQIVFRQKYTYSELTTELADKLKERIHSDGSLHLSFVNIKSSGIYFNPNSGISTFHFVFGSLLTVCVFLFIIFMVFYPIQTHFRYKLPVSELVSRARLSQTRFSRFENVPEEPTAGLEFDNVEVAKESKDESQTEQKETDDISLTEATSKNDDDDTVLVDINSGEN